MELKKIVVAAKTNKNVQTLEILRNSYKDNHILCISEASVSFLDDARKILGEHFMIPSPATCDTKRDQNSFILLRKDYFGNGKYAEPVDITAQVEKYFATGGMCPKLWRRLSVTCKPPVEASCNIYTTHVLCILYYLPHAGNNTKKTALGKGDLYLVYLQNVEKPSKQSFVIGSFHGDTPGLWTIPMIDAVAALLENEYPHCQLFIGMDANCYKENMKGHLFVDDLSECLDRHALKSCFGAPINKDVVTTCMARTFLQPQMNKANLAATRTMHGDVNPKVSRACCFWACM